MRYEWHLLITHDDPELTKSVSSFLTVGSVCFCLSAGCSMTGCRVLFVLGVFLASLLRFPSVITYNSSSAAASKFLGCWFHSGPLTISVTSPWRQSRLKAKQALISQVPPPLLHPSRSLLEQLTPPSFSCSLLSYHSVAARRKDEVPWTPGSARTPHALRR